MLRRRERSIELGELPIERIERGGDRVTPRNVERRVEGQPHAESGCPELLTTDTRTRGCAADAAPQGSRLKGGVIMRRFEYKVLDTEQDIEARLNELGTDGWQVVGVTTKKQLLIAPPAAIILMREVEPAAAKAA